MFLQEIQTESRWHLQPHTPTHTLSWMAHTHTKPSLDSNKLKWRDLTLFFYLGNSVEQKNVCCCENKYFSLLCPLTYTLLELDLSTVINSLSILLGYIYIVEVLALAAVTLAFSRRVVGAPHLIRKPLLRAWNRTTRRLHLTKFFLTKIIRMYLCIVMAARFSSRSRFPSSSWYSSSFRNIYRSQTQILINLSLSQTFVVSVVTVLFFLLTFVTPSWYEPVFTGPSLWSIVMQFSPSAGGSSHRQSRDLYLWHVNMTCEVHYCSG